MELRICLQFSMTVSEISKSGKNMTTDFMLFFWFSPHHSIFEVFLNPLTCSYLLSPKAKDQDSMIPMGVIQSLRDHDLGLHQSFLCSPSSAPEILPL
jgi:hypothetical protein